VTTAQQREAFRRALRQARSEMGFSQRAVARAVGRTASAVWQWEEGRGAPNPSTVAQLERLLQVEPDALARLLGYVPVSETSDGTTSVVDAVNADPRLDEGGRELLTSVYRWLVRHRPAMR
jgi:transcriptional regulator with XRE-family HTH domain